MAQPVHLPIEIKSGSPIVIETSLPDGKNFSLRVVPTILAITWDGVSMNPENPSLPVFVITAQLTTIVEGPT